MPYNTSIFFPILCAMSYIWLKINLFCIPELRAGPCRTVPDQYAEVAAQTRQCCWAGPARAWPNQAVLCLGRAKSPGLGLGHRVSGHAYSLLFLLAYLLHLQLAPLLAKPTTSIVARLPQLIIIGLSTPSCCLLSLQYVVTELHMRIDIG